jgi:hypothetical protein
VDGWISLPFGFDLNRSKNYAGKQLTFGRKDENRDRKNDKT